MTAGRRPDSPNLRVLKGESRPSRAKKVPTVQVGIPHPPAGMSKAALTEWRRVVPALAARGTLTILDRAGLWAYCESWNRALIATAALNAGTPVVRAANARGEKKNPAAQIARDAAAELRGWCVEFGMTPSSRGRMTIPGAEEEDELERLLRS